MLPGEDPPPYSPMASPESGSGALITCRVCQSPINVEGKMHQHVVKCSVCNEATVSPVGLFWGFLYCFYQCHKDSQSRTYYVSYKYSLKIRPHPWIKERLARILPGWGFPSVKHALLPRDSKTYAGVEVFYNFKCITCNGCLMFLLLFLYPLAEIPHHRKAEVGRG